VASSELPVKEDIFWVRRRLLLWFGKNRRTFLWRQSKDPYTVILAEIFLQQTGASTVQQFLPSFISAYPDWRRLSQASQRALEDALMPIGLYRRRAKSLSSLARIVRDADSLPTTRDELESLPGIGQYIANAYMATVLGKQEPMLDTNMARVLERVFGPRSKADIRYDPYLQTLARRLVGGGRCLDLNWSILDLASAVCTARSPKCDICPLVRRCRWSSHQHL
jgi:A/G-specific adenine glycosylase